MRLPRSARRESPDAVVRAIGAPSLWPRRSAYSSPSTLSINMIENMRSVKALLETGHSNQAAHILRCNGYGESPVGSCLSPAPPALGIQPRVCHLDYLVKADLFGFQSKTQAPCGVRFFEQERSGVQSGSIYEGNVEIILQEVTASLVRGNEFFRNTILILI